MDKVQESSSFQCLRTALRTCKNSQERMSINLLHILKIVFYNSECFSLTPEEVYPEGEGNPTGTVQCESSYAKQQDSICHFSLSWPIFCRVMCLRGGNIWRQVQCLTPQVRGTNAKVSGLTTRSYHSCLSRVATLLASRGPLGALSLFDTRPHVGTTVQSINLASHAAQISSDTNTWSWKVTKYLPISENLNESYVPIKFQLLVTNHSLHEIFRWKRAITRFLSAEYVPSSPANTRILQWSLQMLQQCDKSKLITYNEFHTCN
jgi:hypothetical protein